MKLTANLFYTEISATLKFYKVAAGGSAEADGRGITTAVCCGSNGNVCGGVGAKKADDMKIKNPPRLEGFVVCAKRKMFFMLQREIIRPLRCIRIRR